MSLVAWSDVVSVLFGDAISAVACRLLGGVGLYSNGCAVMVV